VSERSFFAELARRNVFRAGALYAGAIWALAQGIAQLGPSFGMPDWGTRWFVIAGVIGFPFWLAFAWFYEFTPEGLKRESEIDPADSITAHTGRKRDRWIFAVMRGNLFDKIHADPRWLPFLRRIGKDPETLAKIEFKVTLPKEWEAEAASAAAAAEATP